MAGWLDRLLIFDSNVSTRLKTLQQRLPRHLKDQLLRASSSVALNLNEGWGRRTEKDRMRFFTIALGSLREVQSISKLENLSAPEARCDFLGACVYKLVNGRK